VVEVVVVVVVVVVVAGVEEIFNLCSSIEGVMLLAIHPSLARPADADVILLPVLE
jgi:hypothetical protein